MSISIDRYVMATSGVIGASVVAQRELTGLRFTEDARVPIDAQVAVDLQGAIDYFGANSVEAAFAGEYFDYVSPAPASKARLLRFAAYAPNGRAATIYGLKAAYRLTQFTPITTGSLNLTIGSATTLLTGINLSTATSLADVASAIQTAVRAYTAGGLAWTAATVSYNAEQRQFVITSGATGSGTAGTQTALTGNDLAPLLGWQPSQAIYSPGSAVQTALEALVAAQQVTDSFGTFSYASAIDLPQAIEIARYNAALNIKYMFLCVVTIDEYQSFYAALASFASVGLILNRKVGEYKESLVAAITAAIDYSRRDATVNYMYRQGPFTAPYDVTTDDLANLLDAARVNYYGETSSAGQKLAFFQTGVLCGGATAPTDMNVHANEQWLKSYLQARLLNLQLVVGKIPANNDGRGYGLAVITEAANLAKFNGTISVGKELDVAQQVAISQITGDTDAWRDVQTNGWWADVSFVKRVVNGVERYVMLYTLAYSKNDVVRSIEGSHNLV